MIKKISGILLVLISFSISSFGTHILGGELTYKYIGSDGPADRPFRYLVHFVGSGLLVWVAASVRGGVLANSRLDPLANGFSLYVSSVLANINAPQFSYILPNFAKSFGFSNYALSFSIP